MTAYLSLWLVLLYAVSARQVFGPLGAIGQPAMALSLAAFMLWLAGWLLPDSGLSRAPHPLRPALLVYLGYQVVSYAIAMARPLTELESSGATRALIIAVAMTGIGLAVADGCSTNARLATLLRRVVLAGTLLSLVGILQFFLGSTFQFRLPGLQFQGELAAAVGGRSIFNRPYGNALHPIEFSVVTASLLPLAIHFALYTSSISGRRNYATCAALIGLAMPLAISRSGIVCIVAAMGVLALGWDWRRRLYCIGIAAVVLPLIWLTIPGLVGTLRSLFQGTDNDPSIQARIDRVPRIMEHIREYPVFGRGNGTWSVEDYFLIDNELWVTTIEMGIVGMTATFVLVLLGAFVALGTRSLPGVDEATGHLGSAVAASIVGLGTSILTFDAFHYRILTGTLFLLLGAAGAMWRLNKPRYTEMIPESPTMG